MNIQVSDFKHISNENDAEYIELLEQHIERQDAIIYRAVKKLKTESKMEWIPCSERLPNYREAVLISTFWGVRVAERDAVKEDGTDDFWYLFLDDATADPRYVYAWMPLPEPYKGNDEELAIE